MGLDVGHNSNVMTHLVRPGEGFTIDFQADINCLWVGSKPFTEGTNVYGGAME